MVSLFKGGCHYIKVGDPSKVTQELSAHHSQMQNPMCKYTAEGNPLSPYHDQPYQIWHNHQGGDPAHVGDNIWLSHQPGASRSLRLSTHQPPNPHNCTQTQWDECYRASLLRKQMLRKNTKQLLLYDPLPFCKI